MMVRKVHYDMHVAVYDRNFFAVWARVWAENGGIFGKGWPDGIFHGVKTRVAIIVVDGEEQQRREKTEK